jgi:hypothetical protein
MITYSGIGSVAAAEAWFPIGLQLMELEFFSIYLVTIRLISELP